MELRFEVENVKCGGCGYRFEGDRGDRRRAPGAGLSANRPAYLRASAPPACAAPSRCLENSTKLATSLEWNFCLE